MFIDAISDGSVAMGSTGHLALQVFEQALGLGIPGIELHPLLYSAYGVGVISWPARTRTRSCAASRHFVGKLLVHEGFETLLERMAAETIVQVSGWDPNLTTELSRYSPEDLVAGITTPYSQKIQTIAKASCGPS